MDADDDGRLGFYEFFAGGGMARAGLGRGWICRFANDLDPKKARAYRDNWGVGRMVCGDVGALVPADLPGRADLAWASFPCQDLSLAGARWGLGDAEGRTRSGAFWPFWALMRRLAAEGRAPRVVALENVPGVLRSNGGRDFAALCAALAEDGRRFGALMVDAAWFVPQSRPRVFFLAVNDDFSPGPAIARGPTRWHPPALVAAQAALPEAMRRRWVWWDPPEPPRRRATLADLVDCAPGAGWSEPEETERLLDLMAPSHRARVEAARAAGALVVATVYRRTRPDAGGGRRQRAEARFDGLAGCLRTPSGGSSRQTVLVLREGRAWSRLISTREAARLMGLGEEYRLPARYNDAYHLVGDGVAPPVVRFLAETLIEPILWGGPGACRSVGFG